MEFRFLGRCERRVMQLNCTVSLQWRIATDSMSMNKLSCLFSEDGDDYILSTSFRASGKGAILSNLYLQHVRTTFSRQYPTKRATTF